MATSGGVDSIVLCKLCQLASLDFGIAHCNFQLRGEDSERDELFVKKFAAQLGVPFYSTKFETLKYAEEEKISTQVAARDLRYEWFEKIRLQNNFDYILTAHHADDNIETVVMSFFRGTGIKGLTGIKQKRGKVIRPLLFARRQEVGDFLNEMQLSYVQDESNLSDVYTRNYFRNTVLPMIVEVYPEVEANILRNIERMAGVNALYEEVVADQRKRLLQKKGKEFFIPILLLQKQVDVKTVLYELSKEFDFKAAQLPDVFQLLQSESGRYVSSCSHRILRNRKHLVIAPLKETIFTRVVIENSGLYPFANGAIEIKEIARPKSFVTNTEDMALIDAKCVEYPMILRPWQTGDYFYPLGMQKKKKISRFLIDKKVSMTEKENVWVLEMNKKVVWVIGHRIDDRFKMTAGTTRAIQIKYIRSSEK